MDGDPANNVLTNLKWGTRSENIQDAVRHGTARFEEKHPNAKLTREKVSDIKAMLKTHTAYRISKIVGMSHGAIQMIESGRTWKTVEAAQ